MHKPEPNQENKMHTIFWDFEIQTDHSIQVRKANLIQIIKKKLKHVI